MQLNWLIFSQTLFAAILCEKFKLLNYANVLGQWHHYSLEYQHLKEWNLEKLFPDLALPNNTDCYGKCPYLLYEHTSPEKTQDSPTVLLVSSFHGNETLSAQILTHAYPYLSGHHILFMPLVNPSGYAHSIRTEYPSMIDPNRDFPYDTDPNTCMRGAASRIMDRIYRHWKIDLTITIHQGGDQIAWAWGTARRKGATIFDNQLHKEFGEAMAKAGGYNPTINMSKIRTGSMNDIIYSATGSFEDWAYGASWEDKFFPAAPAVVNCKSYKHQPYPEDMTNGLVFIFETSTILNIPQSYYGTSEGIELSPNSTDLSNGFVTRGIRVLKMALSITYPKLVYNQTQNEVQFSVHGCSKVRLLIVVQDKIFKSFINGGLHQHPTSTKFNLVKADPTGTGKANISYQFVCDTEWLDLGNTNFAHGRVFKGNMSFSTFQIPKQENERYEKQKEAADFKETVKSVFAVLSVILMFGSFYLLSKIFLSRVGLSTKKDSIKQPSELASQHSQEQLTSGVILRPDDML